MKMKLLKIAALVVAVVLIVNVLMLANSLLGNPISYLLAQSAAERYIAENHPDQGYTVSRVGYDFKFGRYCAYASSESVKDGEFTISVSMWGEVTGSDYVHRVIERDNVSWRLNEDYRAAVEAVLDGWESPYTVDLSYGILQFIREDYEPEYGIGIMKSELELGGIYNISLLGEEAGVIVIYVDSDDVSDEYAAEFLLDLKRVMDSAGVGFCKVDLTLRYPPTDPEVPYKRPEGEILLHGFDYSDIYEDGMVDRVKACIEETRAYYESLSGEKEADITE